MADPVCGYFDHDGTGDTTWSKFDSAVFDCTTVTNRPTKIVSTTSERTKVSHTTTERTNVSHSTTDRTSSSTSIAE